MRFILADDFWVLDVLSPAEWQLLQELPAIASGENFTPSSRERLYPSPLSEEVIADESTLTQVEDWEELIRPELEESFAEARHVVEEDLKGGRVLTLEEFFADEIGMPPAPEVRDFSFPEFYRLEVDLEHTEAWYSSLNQARLLMNEEYSIAGAEERFVSLTPDMPGYNEERMLLVAQYELFSVIQSILVENVMQH